MLWYSSDFLADDFDVLNMIITRFNIIGIIQFFVTVCFLSGLPDQTSGGWAVWAQGS